MPIVLTADVVPLAADADGVVRVANTRVTLDTVVAAFHDGASAEEIVEQYPSLHLGEVYSVIGHYLRHQAEVDAYLETRAQPAAEVRRENERRFSPLGVRDRLIARRERRE